ncbi:MAG: PIN domain-containing protein [Pseudomonadales bacterium]
MTALLDASALLALINVEPGADQVEKVLADVAISTINAAEVASKLNEFGWSPDEFAPLFHHLRLDILSFDLDTALASGQLRSTTNKLGLSLGDRAYIATGLSTHYRILTADKSWHQLKIRGISIKRIR